MTDTEPERSLEERGDDLGKRLKIARETDLGPPQNAPKLKNEVSGLGQAFRIGTELISGLVVGVLLGWWLDHVFDTKPWMMLTFIILGGAAGMTNVYRTAMRMAEDINESEASDATNGNDSDQEDRNSPKK